MLLGGILQSDAWAVPIGYIGTFIGAEGVKWCVACAGSRHYSSIFLPWVG